MGNHGFVTQDASWDPTEMAAWGMPATAQMAPSWNHPTTPAGHGSKKSSKGKTSPSPSYSGGYYAGEAFAPYSGKASFGNGFGKSGENAQAFNTAWNIEAPPFVKGGKKGAAKKEQILDSISKAQAIAANRAIFSDIRGAQDLAAIKRRPDVDVDVMIRNAQLKNLPTGAEYNVGGDWGYSASTCYDTTSQTKAAKPDWTPEHFLGYWINADGDPITIYSADAFAMRMLAQVNRKGRRKNDLNLVLRQSEDGWTCGNSKLNVEKSTLQELRWTSAKGWETIWVRGRA